MKPKTKKNIEKWSRLALGLSSAFSTIPAAELHAQDGSFYSANKDKVFNRFPSKTKADPKAYYDSKANNTKAGKAYYSDKSKSYYDDKSGKADAKETYFWETEFTHCDALVLAKYWGTTVNTAKSVVEDKVAYGISSSIHQALYNEITEGDGFYAGLEYFPGNPVSGDYIESCAYYAGGIKNWYKSSAARDNFDYCDAELLSVYYDEKIRESKSTLGNKAAYGLVDNARTYMLEPAEQSLRSEGYTGTSQFCQFSQRNYYK